MKGGTSLSTLEEAGPMSAGGRDVWDSGTSYERYVGRWSVLVAREFVRWLGLSSGRWLDVGCGTGALAEVILQEAAPAAVHGVDPSEGFLALARERLRDARVRFTPGDAFRLPAEPDTYNAVVSGLVLNFIPDPRAAMTEMIRVARPGGVVGAYVWDYAGRMEMMRHFWDAVAALRPQDAGHDEGHRFPICRPGRLATLFEDAGLRDVDVRGIDVPTRFRDFEDYWQPFLGGQGPAPAYAMSLDVESRAILRDRIRSALPSAADGSINLVARAWAVRGMR